MVISMICLLKNNFYSLKRNWMYWLSYVVVFMFHYMFWLEGDMGYYRTRNCSLDEVVLSVLSVVMLLVFLISAIIPFIAGTEFDGGVIRNKIMAGFSKPQIYMATYITCFIATLGLVIFNILITVVMLCMGQGTNNVMKAFENHNIEASFIGALIFMLVIVIGVMSFSCAVTYIVGKKAIAIIACFLIAFICAMDPLVIRAYADDSPEYFTYYDYDTGVKKEIPNEYYLPAGSPLKKLAIAADSINVFESGVILEEGVTFERIYIYDGKEVGKEISAEEYMKMIEGPYEERFEFNPRYIWGSLAFSVLVTAGGIIIFKKRNIK